MRNKSAIIFNTYTYLFVPLSTCMQSTIAETLAKTCELTSAQYVNPKNVLHLGHHLKAQQDKIEEGRVKRKWLELVPGSSEHLDEGRKATEEKSDSGNIVPSPTLF